MDSNEPTREEFWNLDQNSRGLGRYTESAHLRTGNALVGLESDFALHKIRNAMLGFQFVLRKASIKSMIKYRDKKWDWLHWQTFCVFKGRNNLFVGGQVALCSCRSVHWINDEGQYHPKLQSP